jgi:hypothetical protein
MIVTRYIEKTIQNDGQKYPRVPNRNPFLADDAGGNEDNFVGDGLLGSTSVPMIGSTAGFLEYM